MAMTTVCGNEDESMRLRNVSVYVTLESGEAVPLVEEIELTIRAGAWVNVVGVNGSGKSTLARLLAGLHADGSVGTIERGFAGDVASPVVLQRPEAQLFGETPREEVQFALEWRQVPPERMPDMIERALSEAGLKELADTRWERLSGGQRQLAAAAAASAADCPLIVFDEATSMLDDANRRMVKQMAKRMQKQGTAIVWVTQRLDELEPEERTVAMEGGRIRFDGDSRTFFYGSPGNPSPCEACGLRLPYLAALAAELKKRGRLSDPLPVTEREWREVWGHARSGAGDAR
ncbi:energy-coupling factor ABC transporter ATP-binding protein [Cohnella sp. CFH 77786]|uniref:energy-coupling factor ABC transporter ATP-binding protein n=1 Tax=Cohnella sp. CFH 77786 TaxID=2662265 RepID=UPI0021069001|nr:ABC transporter ATP-binding protein [Cohnella sp. CFH 77786]